MKKISIASFALITLLGTVLFALPASAATTASIAPAKVNVATGQQFNVVVSVDPKGMSNFAEQLQVKYPAELLQVTSFNIGSNWMSLTQPGYDSVDNTNGILIKTAGYAGGITSQTPFGTITFTAKKSGSGSIEIGNGSQAFEKSGQTMITGAGASVVIKASVVVPTVTPSTSAKKNTAPVSNDLTPVTTINGQVVATTTAQEVAAAVAASQVAAVDVAVSSGSGSIWLWVLVIVVLISVLYIIFRRKK